MGKWIIEVRVIGDWGYPVWRAMRPTDGRQYTFETKFDAIAIAKACYPDDWGKPGVIRVTEMGI